MYILSPETDNCPSWISWRERMTIENILWSISTEESCRPWPGSNPRLPGLHWDAHLTVPPRPATFWLKKAPYQELWIECVSHYHSANQRFLAYHIYAKHLDKQADLSKQWRPRSECCIMWSGSTLFDTHPAVHRHFQKGGKNNLTEFFPLLKMYPIPLQDECTNEVWEGYCL